ncbi:hypothetical protein [Flavobacterium sp. FlaQc-47]|uniref:hypothetical protein n=1 Tax=Flavobacterium sp. FlaQc-47 TaxID=3374180 RepID=UPI003757B3E4
MKSYKIILALFISFISSLSAFCQSNIYKEQVSIKLLLDETSRERVKKENVDLQSFVESLYINSSKLFNQTLPAVKKGDYYVLIDSGDSTLENKIVKISELKSISLDKIDELTYKKSALYGALYGNYAQLFGIILIKLKK